MTALYRGWSACTDKPWSRFGSTERRTDMYPLSTRVCTHTRPRAISRYTSVRRYSGVSALTDLARCRNLATTPAVRILGNYLGRGRKA